MVPAIKYHCNPVPVSQMCLSITGAFRKITVRALTSTKIFFIIFNLI